MRYAKVDQNQAVIVFALRSVGASVQSLTSIGKGCPDLAVGFRGVDYKLELKDGRTSKAVKAQQDKWHSEWLGRPVSIVHSVDEALRAIGAIQ